MDRIAQQHGRATLVQRRPDVPDVPEAGDVRGRLSRDGRHGGVGDERRELRQGFVEQAAQPARVAAGLRKLIVSLEQQHCAVLAVVVGGQRVEDHAAFLGPRRVVDVTAPALGRRYAHRHRLIHAPGLGCGWGWLGLELELGRGLGLGLGLASYKRAGCRPRTAQPTLLTMTLLLTMALLTGCRPRTARPARAAVRAETPVRTADCPRGRWPCDSKG
eukprot:scaffold61292_cov64-Phaeocystis_antarctica.AAC.2